MHFKLINQVTGETLIESDEKIAIAILVEDSDRAFLLANNQNITTYLRDRNRERPEIKTVRGRYGLENRMKV